MNERRGRLFNVDVVSNYLKLPLRSLADAQKDILASRGTEPPVEESSQGEAADHSAASIDRNGDTPSKV